MIRYGQYGLQIESMGCYAVVPEHKCSRYERQLQAEPVN